MKIKFINKEFPLVALFLIGLCVISLLVAFHRTQQMVSALRSDTPLMEAYSEPPFDDVYDSDYDLRIPELTYAEPIWDRFGEARIKQFPESQLVKREDGKMFEVPSKVRFGEYQYRVDYEESNIPIEDDKRTLAVVNSYGPRILFHLFIAFVSVAIAFALFHSYRKGYVVSGNVRLIQISSIFAGVVIAMFYFAKYMYLHQLFGNPFSPLDPEFGYPYGLLTKSVVLPSLLAIGVLAGLSHIVCDNMRNSIAMKEEIDGTV